MPEPIGEIPVVISGDYSRLQRDLAAAEGIARGAAQKLQEAFGAMTQAGAVLTGAITAPIVGLGLAAVKMSEQLNQAGVSFTTMLGSAEKAAAFMEEIKNFALSTPFQFPELVDASKRMMALGFAARDVVPTLRIVGDTVATMGGGKAQLDGIVLALGQMQAKARVSAQEMNQLAERGIPAWELLAKTIGTSIPEAMKLAEKGSIHASVAIPAILEGMNDKFKGQMGVMSKTLTGVWSNFQDQVTFVLADVGKVLAPVLKDLVTNFGIPLLETIKGITVQFAALDPRLQQAIVGLAGLAAAAGPVLAAVGLIGQGVLSLGAAATAMGVSWAGLAAAASAAAVPLLAIGTIIAGIHFSGLDAEAMSFASTLKNSIPGLANLFQPLIESTGELLANIGYLLVPIESLRTSILSLLSSLNPKAILDFINPFAVWKDVLKEAGGWLEYLSGNYKSMADAGVAGLKRLDAAQKNYGLGQSEAIERSREYNATLDALERSSRKRGLFAKEQSEEEKKAAGEREAAYRELLKAQKEAEDQTNKFHKALVNAGLRHPKFDQVQDDLVSLSVQLNRGEISAEQFAKGMANLKAQLSTDIGEAMRVAARDAEILFESLNKLSAGELGENFKDNSVAAELMAASLKQASEEAESASRGPLLSLDSALRVLKITADEAGRATTDGLIALNAVLRDGDYETVALVWSKMGSQIERLARTNLPAAIEAWNALLDSLKRNNAPLGEQLELQEKITEAIIQAKTERGISATADIIALDNIRRAQEKLSDATRRWGDLYLEIRGTLDSFLSQIAPTLVNSLWGNDQNDQLKQQANDLRGELADTAAEFASFGESIGAQMEEARTRIADTLAGELDDLKENLAEKESAYEEYKADIATKLDELRESSAEGLAEDLANLQDKLNDKQNSYDEYYDDVQEKIRRLVDDDAEALAEQLDNLQDSLRDKTQSYEDYVQDVNTSLGRIEEDLQGDIQDQNIKTERNIADKNQDYDRDERDTLDRIERLKKAGKKENDAEIVDLRRALDRKKQDRDEYNRRQREDLARATAENKRAADRQRADLKTNLEQRTRDYKEFVAENTQDVSEVTSEHKKDLDRQVGDLKASLLERQHELLAYIAETALQGETLRAAAAKKLGEEEADLMASLAKKTTEHENYKVGVALKAEELRQAAAEALAEEEADLAASLAKKTEEYEKYKIGVAAKLQELKDAHQTVWDEIAEMVVGKNGVLNQIANSIVYTITKPLTDFLGDLAGKALEGFLESGVGKAITGFFEGIFDKLFGSLFDIGTTATKVAAETANTSAVVANTAAIVALTASITGSAAAGAVGDAAGAAGSAAGGIGGAVGSVASGALGIVNAISGVATAVSSIIGNFQMAGMNKSLDIIVLHTLQTANDLANLRRDAWDREAHLMLKLDDLWRTLLNIYDFMGANLTAPLQVYGVPGLSPAIAGASMDSAGVLSGGSSRANVYVNALDPSARATTKALVRGLEEVGIKVR